ncbi:NUDIX hydrolase [Lutibaculum baratangense]|uniref:Putative NUDIX family protein n=1 Tax=Lutibaculum baratangense AMV1 TaxID=631454 RepID=V4TJ66_9HYPH|nr:NUDIX hydrolase [Lutibaculum baratangense]ESR25968.1 putative NUDIX family protein [Lutibaculum baratangense AMV1]
MSADLPDFEHLVPEGDSVTRAVCRRCGFINYQNPKIVVGSVVRADGGILMCRRAIEPRSGYWTLPAGYLEQHETPEDGARREAQEEACAEIAIDALLAVYSIPRLSQVQLIYRARLASDYAPGPESREVEVFAWEAIPWPDLAFPSVHWALRHEREAAANGGAPFANPDGTSGGIMPDGGPWGGEE